jgi:hypothetical protein
MAPESERAKMCGMLATVNGVKMACSQLEGHGNFHTLAPEQPDEPTLTCSEVVERLAKLCDVEAETVDRVARCASDSAAYLGTAERLKMATFRYMASVIRTQATAVLHSWRERRVQELEEALEDAELSVAHVFFRSHDHLPKGCDGCKDVERTLVKVDPRRVSNA